MTPDETGVKNGLEFILSDFEQAFAEKRRLEDQTWDLCKFIFTANGALSAIALGLFESSSSRTLDLTAVTVLLLSLGFATGLFLVLMMTKNRVYFVLVCRYINEIRGFLMKRMPLGFENKCGYYDTPAGPPYFSWTSSQTWALLLVALLNAVVAGVLSYVLLHAEPATAPWLAPAIGFVLWLIQAYWVKKYLSTRDGKSAGEAVWGRRYERAR